MAVTNINNIVNNVREFGAQRAQETEPKVIKGVEKMTKITPEYLIYDNKKVYFNNDRPYFSIKDYDQSLNIQITFDTKISEFPEKRIYLDTKEAEIALTAEKLKELTELVNETKKQTKDIKTIFYTEQTSSKLLTGAKITIGGNDYMVCHKSRPVQRDESGFYYMSESRHFNKLDGEEKVTYERCDLKNREIEFISIQEEKIARYLSPLASRGSKSGKAEASQKLEEFRDKVEDKKVVGYINIHKDSAVTIIKQDEEGYYYDLSPNKKHRINPNQFEAMPVYYDADKKQFYHEQIWLGGLGKIRRYIPESCERLIRKN